MSIIPIVQVSPALFQNIKPPADITNSGRSAINLINYYHERHLLSTDINMPPKRAPRDTEQLLCAMLKLRGLPRGAEWQKVADILPGNPHPEAVRAQWRRLRAKWDEEDILAEKNEGEQQAGTDAARSPSLAKAPKAKKKGEGKKAKAKHMSKQFVSDHEEEAGDEDQLEVEGTGTVPWYEEDDDAGINVLVTKKRIRQAKKSYLEEADEELEDEEA
ncbi:hypothetical protein BDZ45DRAFT_735835 [Acephala macrosclerotiorum]|nr:hypothetical protein BDZ45DRAFT_735835 [Acephala macrosclerotiorum]